METQFYFGKCFATTKFKTYANLTFFDPLVFFIYALLALSVNCFNTFSDRVAVVASF
jgi:hypothetical protein